MTETLRVEQPRLLPHRRVVIRMPVQGEHRGVEKARDGDDRPQQVEEFHGGHFVGQRIAVVVTVGQKTIHRTLDRYRHGA